MGGRNPGRRTRALGTRDHVLSCLADGEISDPKGMARTVLAEAVGYPGSSAAFAQLLSGMERSGLIEREIRGKRTYRIAATAAGRSGGNAPGSGRGGADAPGARRRRGPREADSEIAVTARRGDQQAPAGDSSRAGDLMAAASQAPDFDYDELARRLLVQVVRRLAVAPGQDPPPGHDAGGPEERTGAPAEIPGLPGAGRSGADPASTGPDAALQQAVAGLEQKLASVRSRQRRLTAENAKLREQLQAARQSLAQAEERASAAQVTGQLGGPELQLLERLLSAARDQPGRPEEAGAG